MSAAAWAVVALTTAASVESRLTRQCCAGAEDPTSLAIHEGPAYPFAVEESERITGWARIRFSVPPGMTGLWQVSGRNALSYDDLRHLDCVYAASWSLLWDLRILLQTPGSVLHRRGVL